MEPIVITKNDATLTIHATDNGFGWIIEWTAEYRLPIFSAELNIQPASADEARLTCLAYWREYRIQQSA